MASRFCGRLRKRSSIPVIMLTARARSVTRVEGLDRGADDYLQKPFGPDELLARIRAVMRRYKQASQSEPELLRVGSLELNLQARVEERWKRACLD